MSLPSLKTLGLSDKEAQLYELLLHQGEISVGRLIAETGLKRPTVYKALYRLEELGLAEHEDIDKKIHFRPLPPDRLMELANRRAEAMQDFKRSVQTLLPELTSTYLLRTEKPIVTTFEGVSGLKKMYMDTIKEAKPISAFLTTAEVEPQLFDWLNKTYVPLRRKHDIHATVIASSGDWAREYKKLDAKGVRDTYVVPENLYPFEHEINIYGSKVAFMTYKKGEPLIGIIINHPLIAKSMKAVFDLALAGAKALDASAA